MCELIVNKVDGALTMYIKFISLAIQYCLGLQVDRREEEEESKDDIYFEK